MAKLFIEDTTLSAIGDAIRSKTGSSDLIAPLDMPTAIGSITTGGGGGEDITEVDWTTISSGNFTQIASNGLWDWAIERYGSIIKFPQTSSNIYESKMFQDCKLSDLSHLTIPISNYMDYMFYNCYKLTKLPKFNNTSPIDVTSIGRHFADCLKLREIPYDYFTTKIKNSSNISNALMIFYDCKSLRQLPDLSAFHQVMVTSSASNTIYRYFFGYCFALDTIPYIPIISTTLTANCFVGTFEECSRVTDVLFATQEDGTPYNVNWNRQTIDLSVNVGYSTSQNSFIHSDYNNGLTTDTQITDDATYAALKDNPDSFTNKVEYSRYNHDSAVETINSLPDTSAYLATQTSGTNTIKFKGASGSATDGGAISNLTEAEIAVAAAKGWTVSIV